MHCPWRPLQEITENQHFPCRNPSEIPNSRSQLPDKARKKELHCPSRLHDRFSSRRWRKKNFDERLVELKNVALNFVIEKRILVLYTMLIKIYQN